MDRFELAALYTLQYGLARDPKREHCVADGKEVLPGILAESRFDVIGQPNAPRGAGCELLTTNYSIVEQTMQGRWRNAERGGGFLNRQQFALGGSRAGREGRYLPSLAQIGNVRGLEAIHVMRGKQKGLRIKVIQRQANLFDYSS